VQKPDRLRIDQIGRAVRNLRVPLFCPVEVKVIGLIPGDCLQALRVDD
jgi:hypothetical protein